MHPRHRSASAGRRTRRQPRDEGRLRRFLRRWFVTNTLLAGILALAWLVLRSGSKPSRFAYPCQQAAVSAAALAFGAPLVSAILVVRRRLVAGLLTPRGIAVAATGLIATLSLWGYMSRADAYRGPLLAPPGDYRAQVFHQTGCAPDPVGDHFPGLDDLLELMGGHGLKLHRSPTTSLTAGPDGIIASDDVVVIKINYQWSERGGTNTDLLRGLIRRLVDHPDTFTGEIAVCENAQFRPVDGFDRSQNNAQNHEQSPHDVVADFQAQGFRVSHYDWTALRFTEVDEYSTGDMTDGYVAYPFDQQLLGRVSYPKFQTAFGTRISLKDGLWTGSGHDRAHLKFINIPVLKSHHSTYGATVAVKNYMGVVTGQLSTNSHSSIRFGLLGALLGEIGLADLNIIDAIWINADPNKGPGTSYDDATRRDELVGSVDPVAADIWAVKNILIPGFIANGFTPPWPEPNADPDDPNSDFREYLDNSMSEILAAGHDVTNDLDQIDRIDVPPPGEASDPGGAGIPFTIAKDPGGYELTWSDPVRGGPVVEFNLYRTHLAGPRHAARPQCEAALGSGNSVVLPDLPDGHGFLVVARNTVSDGSFGSDSRGIERPDGGEDTCP
jgi:hypothetical protein